MQPEILYQDRDLVVCVKPVGVLSPPDGKDDETLMDLLAEVCAQSDGRPVHLHPVHRLDRGVGGVMVYAKNPTAAAKLSTAIQQNQLSKEYFALVHGVPAENSGELRDLLFRDAGKNKTFVVNRLRKGVKEAVLDYRTLFADGERALVLVHLHTGRTHQIRVQFASRKHPLWGDGKYGGSDNGCPIGLWSFRLKFSHPRTGEKLIFCAFPPAAKPWDTLDWTQIAERSEGT